MASLNGRAKQRYVANPETASGAVKTKQVINNDTRYVPMSVGLETRTRRGNYPEIISQGSLHTEATQITTTERSVGMPPGAPENFFYKMLARGAIQISSSSTDDVNITGTGAWTVSVSGLELDDNDNWVAFSETLALNGQNAVVGTETTWWRVNFHYTLDTGTGLLNAGDLYVSPSGTALTNGVPDENVLCATIAGFNSSSSGDYSVASNRTFHYVKGNFFIDSAKEIVYRERYQQDTTGDGVLNEYHVGYYPVDSISYGYEGAGPYTAKTDILLSVFTATGTASYANYYVEFALCDNDFLNLTPSPIFTTGQ